MERGGENPQRPNRWAIPSKCGLKIKDRTKVTFWRGSHNKNSQGGEDYDKEDAFNRWE